MAFQPRPSKRLSVWADVFVDRHRSLRSVVAVSCLLIATLFATACQAQTTVEFTESGVAGDTDGDTAVNVGSGSAPTGFASAADVYDSIVDSIVFVETPQGRGGVISWDHGDGLGYVVGGFLMVAKWTPGRASTGP